MCIRDRRWDGSAWVEMGDSASGGGISHMISWSGDPALAVGSEGPVVAWSQNTGGEDSEIYVRRWDGAAWVEMGGSASGGGISHMPGRSGDPALAVGSDGPVVAWSQETDGDDPEIYVRRWDGADWVEMGAGSASGGGISDNDSGSLHPSLAVGPDGPIVAWEDYDDGDDGEIYVRGWDGSAWVEMGGSASGGGISDNDGWSESTTLAVGPDGPIVAWHYISDDNVEIYARRWDGSAWVGTVSYTHLDVYKRQPIQRAATVGAVQWATMAGARSDNGRIQPIPQ